MSDSTLHPAHPDADLLAEHAEELLTPEQSADLTAHLASCEECRETYDALVELTALLGAEPAPGPMPDDVAARIDAALAAERAADAPDAVVAQDAVHSGAHSAAPDAPDAPQAPDGESSESSEEDGEADADRVRSQRRPGGQRPEDNRPRNRSTRSIRIRRVLATLALFVAAGGIGLAVSRGGDLDSGSSSTSAAGGSSATAPSPKALAGSAYDFTQTNLTSEVQRLASDSARLHAAGHAAGTAPSGSAPATSFSTAGTPSGTPSANTSPAGVGALVTPNGGAESGATSPAQPAQPTAPACVLAATKQTQPPAVQGLGQYLDVQVFALLYPDSADPAHTWDVYLVQNSCSAPLVMLHQSVPRG
ncbi:anti-sigma factor family protein [Streptacidiphilus anmyonensis]|uniref:anti-sigma factor family protein n=1 Tax=Streptacidiphilus anmyonensis TaxID=405782 RepID=UPI0005A7404D|nr:zf-HC2 domain-containing protein [Streptacidiphilus anmyonensis]